MSTSLLHTLYIKSSPLLILVDFIMSFICLDLVSSSEFICFLVVCPTLAVLVSAAHGVRMACWVLKGRQQLRCPMYCGWSEVWGGDAHAQDGSGVVGRSSWGAHQGGWGDTAADKSVQVPSGRVQDSSGQKQPRGSCNCSQLLHVVTIHDDHVPLWVMFCGTVELRCNHVTNVTDLS